MDTPIFDELAEQHPEVAWLLEERAFFESWFTPIPEVRREEEREREV